MTLWGKKIITLIMMPLPAGLVLMWSGFVLAQTRRHLRVGRLLIGVGMLTLTLLSFQAIADHFIKRLEMCYPALVNLENARNAKWVLVLAGGHASNPDRPPNLQIGSSSHARLVEGMRVHSQLPGSRLLLSGGAVFDPIPEAETMNAVVKSLNEGLEPVLERASKDTGDQTRFVRIILQDDPIVLVNSAIHTPRAMLLFRQQGMQPVPAPVEIGEFSRKAEGPAAYFPRAASLSKVESASHEYLGLLWAKLAV